MWVLKGMTKVSRSLGHRVLEDGYQAVVGEEFKFVAFADSHDIATPSLTDLEVTNMTSLKIQLKKVLIVSVFRHFHTPLFTVQLSRGPQEHLPITLRRNFQNMHWESSGRKCRKRLKLIGLWNTCPPKASF